jgi:hypothetical protein
MLYLDAELPPGALVDQAGPALAAIMAGVSGLWFQADPDHVETRQGVATAWRPRQGFGTAQPAQPNKGHGKLGLEGLELLAGKNCGFALEGAVANATNLSFAVLYNSPTQDIRTLLSIKLAAAKNYLFLYEQEGLLGLKDQGGAGSVTCDIQPSQGQKLVVGGLSGKRLYLRQGAAPVQATDAPDLDFTGPADLFIGCRSHREGLLKTFGTGAIAAVFLWPTLNILDPASPAALAQLRALDQYRFWDA